jgi:hypothetical protein
MRDLKMKNIATFDIETDPFKYNRVPVPFCCDFFNGEKHTTFWGDDCIKKAYDLISKFEGYVYAHNGGNLLGLGYRNSKSAKLVAGTVII